MSGSFTTTAIITKGLTGANVTVCRSGIITTFFSLYCAEEPTPPVVAEKNIGGGPYPKHAWNKFAPGDIQNFYKPVDVEQPYLFPTPGVGAGAYMGSKRGIITIKVKFGEKEYESNYSVSEKTKNQVVNVINFVNTTVKNIKVAVSNIKRLTNNIVVKVKNFHLKR